MNKPGYWSLGDMVDKIEGYAKIMKQHGFISNGEVGTKPFSIRHTHANGTRIDTRNTEWTMYGADGQEMHTGPDPKALEKYLLNRMSREELIALMLA